MRVGDNGRGIDPELLSVLGNRPLPSKEGTGTALYNLNQRLIGLFGFKAALRLESEAGKGTDVSFELPLKLMTKGEEHAEGVNR